MSSSSINKSLLYLILITFIASAPLAYMIQEDLHENAITVVGPFVLAHRLPQGAREYGNVIVMPPSEGAMIVGTRIPFVFPYGPGRKQA